MTVENLLQCDGTMPSTGDYRNTTVNGGTTYRGPNGSAQFLGMKISTSRVVGLSTTAGAQIYGVLQNKPSAGEAANVAVFGITKAVAGSTFPNGTDLECSSSGDFIPYSSAAGINRCGRAIEDVTAVGQIFSMALYGFGQGGGSIA